MAEFPVKANTQQAVNDIDRLIAALRRTGKEAGLSEAQIDKMIDETKRAKTDGVKNINGLNNELGNTGKVLKTVGGAFAAFFAIDKIKQFVSEVVKVTAEFQKMEAVLTNTLGSKSQAQQALKMIQKLAAQTPFSVLELTQSYVKLVNQGIKPTEKEIVKLGDLAASTGKQFDQLTEAIIDAQTGEFERLKEFGIRASKQGDQVTFTFKGVQTQVAFTSDAIKDYIIALGEAQGVTGSMEAISKTLGGQISNLGDSWDALLNTLGQGQSGILSSSISVLSGWIAKLTELVKTEEQLYKESLVLQGQLAVDNFRKYAEDFTELEAARTAYVETLVQEQATLKASNKEINQELQDGNETRRTELNQNYTRLDQIDLEIEAINEYVATLKKEADQKKQVAADRERAELLRKQKIHVEELRKEYEKLNEALRDFLNDTAIKEIDYWAKVNAGADAYFNNIQGVMAALNQTDTSGLIPDISFNEDEPEDVYARSAEESQAWLDARKEALDSAVSYTEMAFSQIMAIRVQSVQNEIGLLRSQYQYELSLAGENSKSKEKIRKDYARKELELQQKLAQRQKQAAIFGVIVNEGPAIAESLASAPYPYNLVLALAVAGYFATLLADQKNVAEPRFAAEGDFDIKGPGTETSDSIPYWLSVHETVTPAHATKRFGKLLRPMVENKDLDWGDIKDIVAKELPTELPALIFNNAGADSPELLEELKATRRAIENKQEHIWQVDENGFTHWVGNRGTWTNYKRGRYGL